MMTLTRRSFMRNSATAGILTTFPFIRATGRESANEKVNLACIGIGNRGENVVSALSDTKLCNVVALCDTDMGASHTKKIIAKFPDVPRFQDFRKMFDKMGNQIDAVSVATPDHSHFAICMMAMKLGKHVYVEKPMAHSFLQLDLMMAAEKKYKVATQMGNQGHSGSNYWQYKALTEAGVIKNVRKIVAHMNGGRRWHKWKGQVAGFREGMKVPDSLDWDTWLAQAPFHDFHTDYVGGEWRSWFEFGNGALGDWGAHILDTSHEFLRLGLPTEVSPEKMEGWNAFVFPMASTLRFTFPERGQGLPACDVYWYDGTDNLPELPKGYGKSLESEAPASGGGSSAGKKLGPGKEIYTDDLIFKGSTHGAALEVIPEEKAKEMKKIMTEYKKGESSHFRNFLKACKGQESCVSRFEVAGPLCQMMALGVLCQRVNAKLEFNRETRKITNHEVANGLLMGPPPRKGWESFYQV